jgi:hypothetical protein
VSALPGGTTKEPLSLAHLLAFCQCCEIKEKPDFSQIYFTLFFLKSIGTTAKTPSKGELKETGRFFSPPNQQSGFAEIVIGLQGSG